MNPRSDTTRSLDSPSYESRTTPVVPMSEDPRADGRNATEPRTGRRRDGGGGGRRFAVETVLAERYQIVELVGRGGMGEVYRADDLKLDQTVALKFLPEDVQNDPDRLALLVDEVRLARCVTHPNVCRVYDIGEVDGSHFLSMELIEGEDLSALIERDGAMPLPRALRVGQQLCEGLEAIHAQGILHRDLKPSNVMVATDGRARITDFGLASLPGDITAETALHGTPTYMAPEQIAHRKVSRQTDIYALGMVLYKLFTGRPAFARAGSGDREVSAESGRAEPISRLVDGVAPEVEAVILACLDPDPRGRPASAAAVAAVLAGAGKPALKALLAVSRGHRGDTAPDGAHGGAADASRDGALGLVELAASLGIDAIDTQAGTGDVGVAPEPGHSQLMHIVLDRPIDAARLALALGRRGGASAEHDAPGSGVGSGVAPAPGVAIDLCEYTAPVVSEARAPGRSALDPAGLATTARLAALARPGQILLSRSAFDLARQSPLDRRDPREDVSAVRWLAHGSYEIEGMTEPLGVFEVGVEGESPLCPPPDTDTCRRMLVQRSVAGWRPAPGLELPRRPHWIARQRISEGGFGEVWLVEHAKTGERRVFKFCHDAEKLRAFQREITLFRLLRDALGDRHDIARIYDWSFDEAPYFIESAYSPGGNLREWAEAQGGLAQVPLEMRIELVSQVATALAAAHSVGVLHKDVKPTNILISTDADGCPRAQLSDFGIGAVTDRDRLDDARITVMGFTETVGAGVGAGGVQAGTRLYMAPELLEGKPATVQADVYALGVTLYQAMAGDFSRAIGAGWERHVADELLREDIAAAIEGAPEQRLGSAAALAERLQGLEQRRQEREQREREHKETRLAREALYRSRRRLKLAAVAIVAMASLAGAMVYHSSRIASESRRAEHQRQVAESEKQAAEREKRVAEEVVELLIEIFRANDPHNTQGKEIGVRDLLSSARDKVRQLGNQPEVQARLMHTLGVVHGGLGLYDDAIELLQHSLEIQRRLFGEVNLNVAETLHQLAHILSQKRQYAAAEFRAQEARVIRWRLLGMEHVLVAKSTQLLAEILYFRDKLQASEDLYRAALSIFRSRLGEQHVDIAGSLRGLATVLLAKGEYEQAQILFRQSINIYRDLNAGESLDAATALHHLALCLQWLEEREAAVRMFQEALEIKRRILGEKHPGVAGTMHALAYALMRADDLEGAERLYADTLMIYQRTHGKESEAIANLLTEMGSLARVRSRYMEAVALCERALSIFEQLDQFDDFDAGITHNQLAHAAFGRDEYKQAEVHYRAALEIFRRYLGEEHPSVSIIMTSLAAVLVREGRLHDAEPLIQSSMRILQQRHTGSHWRLDFVENVRGFLRYRLNKDPASPDIIRQSYQRLKQSVGMSSALVQIARAHVDVLGGSNDDVARADP